MQQANREGDLTRQAWTHTTLYQPATDTQQRFVVTAWRNRQELLQVRHDLYSSDTGRRERALNKVFAWRVRKSEGLPLLLDSTADIIDVAIQDEKGQLKHNALRLLYAAAISRFVTGLADTQIELIRDRPSWFPPGKCLQLPLGLLETRHRIVHRHLPTLVELKRAAKESLDWLWEWYWSQLDHALSLPKDDEEPISTETLRESLNVFLKTYVKERKNEIKARYENSRAAENALSSYKLQFAANGASGLTIRIRSLLFKLLIDEKMILPTDRKFGSSMSGAFLVWNPFLTMLCVSSNEACTISTLLSHLKQAMNGPSMFKAMTNKEVNPAREGMHDWLIHMLTSDEWKSARGEEEPIVMEDVLASCFSEPTYWNLKLATTLLDKHKAPNYEQWQAVLHAATSEDQIEMENYAQLDAQIPEDQVTVTEPGVSIADSQEKEKEPEEVAPKEKSVGPRKVVGMWKPRPIGWMPEGWEDYE